jgi:type 1 fimbriae regulatory protein FimB/type 1 fimbriae regulatory protein FimE
MISINNDTQKQFAKSPIKEQSTTRLYVINGINEPQVNESQLPFSEQSRTTPRKPTNISQREREYLTKNEVHQLIDAAKRIGRYGKRDALMILLSYRHGFRVSELVALQWHQIDLETGKMHVNRSKKGDSSVHLLQGDEIRSLRELKRTSPESPFVFVSERLAPFTTRAIHKIVSKAGVAARFPFTVHCHMLRHACGYQLANSGQDTRAIQAYLGHKNINHTVKYTALCSDRFKDFGKIL